MSQEFCQTARSTKASSVTWPAGSTAPCRMSAVQLRRTRKASSGSTMFQNELGCPRQRMSVAYGGLIQIHGMANTRWPEDGPGMALGGQSASGGFGSGAVHLRLHRGRLLLHGPSIRYHLRRLQGRGSEAAAPRSCLALPTTTRQLSCAPHTRIKRTPTAAPCVRSGAAERRSLAEKLPAGTRPRAAQCQARAASCQAQRGRAAGAAPEARALPRSPRAGRPRRAQAPAARRPLRARAPAPSRCRRGP